MMRKFAFSILAFAALVFISCGGGNQKDDATPSDEPKEGPDTMVYGLACDGTNDSVVVLLLFSGEDPITYNVEEAKRNGRIIGQLQIGDWIGVMPSKEDTTEATMVVDLDQLKGTWTYEVRPTWKDASKMSRRALKNKMSEIPDSLKDAYMVPREYGFTLKRSSKASQVGFIMRSNSLEDDSPVEYPAVKNYVGWKCRNGHLILMSRGNFTGTKEDTKAKLTLDTLEFVMMTNDSLVVMKRNGEQVRLHRKESAFEANAEASKAAKKTSDAQTNSSIGK